MTILRLAFVAFATMATSAWGQELRLSLPLDCEIGTTCFIEDYVDQDPDPGSQRDFACGINARDGHKGTDFALLSFDAIETGVDVLAAAPGMVLRVRDGMKDDRLMRGVTSQTACGNAALIDHGNGWKILYCHMKNGSLRVAPGVRVERGQAIGQVGLSGQTNHPHLHVTLYKDGALVDPFQPGAQDVCGEGSAPLFDLPSPYTKTGLITAGFADHIPSMKTVQSGAARLDIGTPTAPLVVYAHSGYAQDGDLLTLSARGPKGEIFSHDVTLNAPQVSLMRAFGKKAPPDGWPAGEYLGEALLTRDGRVIGHRFAHVTIE